MPGHGKRDEEVPDQSEVQHGERHGGQEVDDDEVVRMQQELVDRIESSLDEKESYKPREVAEVVARLVSVEIQEASYRFRGPLPPPDMLREYESVLPGLAKKIDERADREQLMRHEGAKLELANQRYELATDRQKAWLIVGKTYLGQAVGGLLSLVSIVGGIYLLSQGKDAAGLAAVITPLAALSIVFVAGKAISARKPSQDKLTDETG